MFCPWCQQTRSVDISPCPRCNASSPLLDRTTYHDSNQRRPVKATWQGTSVYSTSDEQIFQRSFEEATPFISSRRSLPYEQLERQSSSMFHLVPTEVIEQMFPDTSSEQTTYVPPIYKQVRPLISRKRAISGLLSIILVAFLLCTWAGQNSSASKQVEELSRLVLGMPPASLQQTHALLIRDPKREPDRGPASTIISSATTTGRLDPRTHIAVSSEQIFRPNQSIYLTYTVKPTQKGIVTIKWYTNKIMYAPSEIKVDPADGNIANGYSEMLFVQQTEGYVELYWNNKLAQRLYFAVRT